MSWFGLQKVMVILDVLYIYIYIENMYNVIWQRKMQRSRRLSQRRSSRRMKRRRMRRRRRRRNMKRRWRKKEVRKEGGKKIGGGNKSELKKPGLTNSLFRLRRLSLRSLS